MYVYCLRSNHVFLLINPGPKAANRAVLMKRVAGRQTRYVNARDRRSGTLWEGQYQSSLIKTEATGWPVGGAWSPIRFGREW